jgi:2-dehydro-3-deoxyphosphogluconate aldolase / (4S)-4-hydroxy-2-oxoglutarate aldolase
LTFVEALERQHVLPVLRCAGAEDALATARAAVAGGFQLVELTMTTPDVLEAVAALAADGVHVGLGTIEDSADVGPAVDAGARFVVSYRTPAGFVDEARAAGVAAMPGALTPTELAVARQGEPDAIKLFPASAVAPDYLRVVRPALGSARVVAAGGIPARLEAIAAWLDAGALAVAVGSDLGTMASVGAAEVERRSHELTRLGRPRPSRGG